MRGGEALDQDTVGEQCEVDMTEVVFSGAERSRAGRRCKQSIAPGDGEGKAS